ncbi:hypothetical protein B2G50_17915 [Leptospira interrogans serovar Canicola]|nr:hypothetical protein B2G50_17915 [Leptospira interrogans serovar Canicola]
MPPDGGESLSPPEGLRSGLEVPGNGEGSLERIGFSLCPDLGCLIGSESSESLTDSPFLNFSIAAFAAF